MKFKRDIRGKKSLQRIELSDLEIQNPGHSLTEIPGIRNPFIFDALKKGLRKRSESDGLKGRTSLTA